MAGYDQRIAYHAKHFGAHVAPEKVLHRYAQRLEIFPGMGEVQRKFNAISVFVMLEVFPFLDLIKMMFRSNFVLGGQDPCSK